MKIVGVDNLNRESIADSLWIDKIPDGCEEFARRVCNKLNSQLGDLEGTYYKVVADDYKLWGGMSEFV